MNVHDRIDQIIASYEDGTSVANIAVEHEIPKGYVRAILRLANILLPGTGHEKLQERDAQIIALYRTDLTLGKVGDLQDPKISRERVRQIILRDAPDILRRLRLVNDAMCSLFRSEYEAGATHAEIATRHDFTQSTVSRKLRDMGVKIRRRDGPRGPMAKTIERVAAAFQLRAQGKKWREVADELGIGGAAQGAWTTCHRHPELVP